MNLLTFEIKNFEIEATRLLDDTEISQTYFITMSWFLCPLLVNKN